MYNFIKKAFNLEKSEELKIDDPYLKSILFQAENNCSNEKSIKHIKDIIYSILRKDKKSFRDLCSGGIPDEVPLLRTLIWKINLKFLDLNVNNWPDLISKRRSEYNNLKEAFMMKIEIEKKFIESKNKICDSAEYEENEESKDSSSKSKNDSKNNNSRSRNSGKKNIFLNFNEEKNENKIKNQEEDYSNYNKNFAFGKLEVKELSTKTFKISIEQNDSKNSFIDQSFGKNNQEEKPISSNIICKNGEKISSDFTRNFLNFQKDERKYLKNKNNKCTRNTLFQDFSRIDAETIQNGIEIMKTYGNKESESEDEENSSAANMTFNVNRKVNHDKKLKADDIEKDGQKNELEDSFEILKKLNEEKLSKNKNIYLKNEKIESDSFVKLNESLINGLIKDKPNDINNLQKNKTIDVQKEPKENQNHEKNCNLNKGNQIENGSLPVSMRNIPASLRDTSDDKNKPRNKIDFTSSVFDILNKNVNINMIPKSNHGNNNKIKKDLKENRIDSPIFNSRNKNVKVVNSNILEIKRSNYNEDKKEIDKTRKLEKKHYQEKNKSVKFNNQNPKFFNFEDKGLIEDIYKDMMRTHSEYEFILKRKNDREDDLLNLDLDKILIQRNNNCNLEFPALEKNDHHSETHLDAIARILYIFAKLNKNIRYVQGMNELASLIYFVIMQEEQLKKINIDKDKFEINIKESKYKGENNTISKRKEIKNDYKNYNKNNEDNVENSISLNKSTKVCDLGRLEDTEEEKNFFDLYAERKNQDISINNCVFYDNLQLLGHLQKNHSKPISDDQRVIHEKKIGIDNKKNGYSNLLKKDNNAVKELININNYMEALNEGLAHEFNNQKSPERNYKVDKNKFEKIYKTPINNRTDSKFASKIYYTPDTKEKIVSKLVLDEFTKKEKCEMKDVNIKNNIHKKNIEVHPNLEKQNINKSNVGAMPSVKLNVNAKFLSNVNSKNQYSNSTHNIESDYEADTFWCFCYLMDQLKYIYLRSEDNKERGIMKKMENLKILLKLIDKTLYNHLQNISVDITLFGFKWFILLFSQNFHLPDVIRIWDILLFVDSQVDIFYKVYMFALAVFEYRKNKIISLDFSGIILQLQSLHDINAENLIIIYKKVAKDNEKKIKKALDLK